LPANRTNTLRAECPWRSKSWKERVRLPSVWLGFSTAKAAPRRSKAMWRSRVFDRTLKNPPQVLKPPNCPVVSQVTLSLETMTWTAPSPSKERISSSQRVISS
jgi:hypothetical protein